MFFRGGGFAKPPPFCQTWAVPFCQGMYSFVKAYTLSSGIIPFGVAAGCQLCIVIQCIYSVCVLWHAGGLLALVVGRRAAAGSKSGKPVRIFCSSWSLQLS